MSNFISHQGNTSKITMRYHLSQVRLDSIKKKRITNVGKDVKNLLYTVGKNANYAATMENNLEFP